MKIRLPKFLFRGKSLLRKESLLCGAFLLFGCGSVFSEVHLDVYYNDESEPEIFRASQIELIRFAEDNMLTIHPYFLDCYYTISPKTISRISFSDAEIPGSSVESIQKSAIGIYPNPATSHFTVSGVTETPLQVFSAEGALKINIPVYTGNQINVSSLPSGIYIVKAGNFTSKLIKK